MIKVLYTDDESTLLDIGKMFLERSGEFSVKTALSAPEAIRLLELEKFDAIISDYQMPEMDGIQFLIEVRSRFGPIPFILFTGRGREDIVIQAINSGADFYLQKGGEPKAQFAELTHQIKSAASRKRGEDALRRSEEKFRMIVENSHDIIYTLTADCGFIFVSPAWTALLGHPVTQVIGQPFQKFVHPDDISRCMAFLKSVIETGEPQEGVEYRVLHINGVWDWHTTSAVPIKDDTGTITGIYGIARDITGRKQQDLALLKNAEELRANFDELKRHEQALRESDEKLAAIVAGSPVPQFVIDSDHRIIYWNRALELVTGISAAQVIGTRDQWRAFYPDERPTMADLILDEAFVRISELYAEKFSESPIIAGAFEATDFFPHMGDKGTYLRFTAAPIKNNHGVTLGAVETLIDVSDIKRAEVERVTKNEELQAANEQINATEEELRANLDELTSQERALKESEEKLAAIVAGSPVPQFVIDSDHRIIYWNRALELVTGISAAQVIGTREQWRAFYPDERPTMADLILDEAFVRISELYAEKFSESPVIAGAFEATDFFPHMGAKGTYLRFTAAPIKNNHGVTLGAVETLIDVSDIKRAEVELVTKNDDLQAAFEEITATEEELRANLDELTRQERALRETEERYRNIVEDQTEFICRFRPDGTHVFVNDAYCRYFGVAREDILGHRFSPVIYADDRKAVAAFFATLTPEKPVGTIDHRIVMPDGTVRWQRWNDRALFDDKGIVAEFQSVGRDITEYKEAEEATKRSETQLTAIIQSSPIPKFVIDKDHRVIYWNKALEGYSGIKEKEIVGTNQHWRAFYQVERPCMADLLLDGSIEKISQWYAGKYAKSNLIEGAYEATDFFPHMGEKGTYLRFTASPIKTEQGVTLGAVETLIDVSDIKRAEVELVTKNNDLQAAFEEITATEEELRSNLDELTRQEQALRETEERYRNIVEDQTEFICRFRPDGTYVFVNDAYCRYFGVAREDILGHRFSPVIYADDRKAVAAFFASLTPEKPVGSIDHRIIMPDRTVRWQRWNDRALFDDKGIVIEFQSVGRDITEYKEAEEELQKSEKNYRHLIEHANEAIIVAQDGLLKFVNPMMATMTGYSVEELTTLPYIEIIHPDDRAIVRDRRLRRISGEKISSRYVFRINSRDNRTRWVEISAVNIDWEGRPATLNFLIDITTRRQAEEALKESEEFNRGMVVNMPDMIIVYGLDRKVRYANSIVTRMLGYSIEELSGTDILNYVVPEQRSHAKTVILKRLTSGSTESIEVDILKKDGERCTVITNGSMVHLHGEPAVLLLLTDITDRKILENHLVRRADELARITTSLEQANRKLNLLSSITRHDINNQLSVLVGYLRILEKKQPDPSFSEYFLKISTAAQQISSMIRFTKEYENIGVTTPAWQDTRTLVDTAAKEASLGQVMVKNDIPAGAEMYADPLIVKVCYNLLDNAVRYGGKISTIRFSVQESGNDQLIVCEDDGDGVPADEKEKIFNRGFGKNTGLGLALSREILSITGITIRETGEPGKGARFEMRVPQGMWRIVGEKE